MKKIYVLLLIAVFAFVTGVQAQVTYYSKASATNFASTASWGANTDGSGPAPGSISNADVFIVANGSALTLNANASVRALGISSGSLTVSANTLTVSLPTGNTSTLTLSNGGYLTVNTGGTVNVNGNFLQVAGGVFTQNGGNINVDGNSGVAGISMTTGSSSGTTITVASTTGLLVNSIVSVTAGTGTFVTGTIVTSVLNSTQFTVSAAPTTALSAATVFATNSVTSSNSLVTLAGSPSTIFLNGGTFTIVDPHANSTSVYSLTCNASVATNASPNHTFKFGNGVSTDPGFGAVGFYTYFFPGTSYLILGSVLVDNNVTATNNRQVTTLSNTGILGDLTVNAGGEYRVSSTTYLTGNLVNNGTLTTTSTLNFAKYLNAVLQPATSTQTISGSGIFRNSATTSTANFTSVTFNNTSSGGVIFSNANSLLSTGNTGTVSSTLTFTACPAGVDLSTGTFIQGISATSAGSTSWNGGGFKNGTFKKWLTTSMPTSLPSTTTGNFPFVVNGSSRNFQVANSIAPTTGGSVSVSYVNTSTGLSTVAGTDPSGSFAFNRLSNTYWTVSAGDGFTAAGTFLVNASMEGIMNLTAITSEPRLVQSISAGTGTHGTPTGSVTAPVANRNLITQANFTANYYIGINSANFASAANTIYSVQNGNWNSTSTWNTGVVPASTDAVTITVGTTVTVDNSVSATACNSLSIAINGTLNATANTLNTNSTTSGVGITMGSFGILNISGSAAVVVGATGTNRFYTLTTGASSASQLNVSGGTLTINGNLNVVFPTIFTQTGGTISVDGNLDNASASSVASGVALVSIKSPNLNLTGGTLIIVDPHANATASRAFEYSSSSSYNSGTGHTVQFGNGTSTDRGGNVGGFLVNILASSGRLSFGNFVVSGSATSLGNRNVTNQTSSFAINGNLTITGATGVFDMNAIQLYVAGNITVTSPGILTASGNLTFGNFFNSVASPATNAQTLSGTGTFRNLAAPTANFNSITINNNSASGVTFSGTTWNSTANATVSSTVTFTTGFLNVSGSASGLTLGISGTPGTLSYTAGGFTSGSLFRRWVATTAIAIPSVTGQFPFLNTNFQARHAYFGSVTALTTAGWVAVQYNDVAGTTGVSIVDGFTVSSRSNSNWVVTTGGSLAVSGANDAQLRIRGDGILSLTSVVPVRIVAAAAVAPGTSTSGTGSVSAPEANKSAMTTANLSSTIYFGGSSTITSTLTGGAWESTGTWVGGVVPACGDGAIISSGATVTVNASNANANFVTINSGGTLTLNGSLLTVGCTLNNASMTNNGTLNVAGGDLTVNGNLAIANGSNFTHSSGTITIDGNDNSGTTGNASSVASGTPLFSIGLGTAYSSGTTTLSGGAIIIVDPHVGSGTATSAYAVYANLASGVNINASSSHSFRFGDGSSTATGSSTSGFVYEGFAGSGRLNFGSVIVNASYGVNRIVTQQSFTNAINGNLTVTSGILNIGALTLQVGGNISVATNGRFVTGTGTTSGIVSFGLTTGTTLGSQTTAQSVSVAGSGTIQSALASAIVSAVGSGYVVGDIITLVGTGGTLAPGASQAQFRVVSVSAGTVTGVVSINAPLYTTLPTTPATTTGGTGTSCTLTTLTNMTFTSAFGANFINIVLNNTSSSGVTFNALNNLSGAASFTGASVLNSITFTAGNATTSGANALLWGNALTGGTGSLTVTAGGMTSGSTFARGWSAAQTGTSIVAASTVSATTSMYPFWNTSADPRYMWVQRVTPTVAGIIGIKYNDVAGTTSGLSLADGAYTVSDQSNSNWVFNLYGTTPSATTYTVATSAPNMFGGTPASGNTRIMQSASFLPSAGTGHQAGNPTTQAQRASLTLANLTAGPYYLGLGGADVPFVSVASTAWETPSTWNKNAVPTSTDNVSIANGTTVTVNATASVASTVTVNSGGTLAVSGSTLGVTTTLVNNGTLNVSGGSLTATTSVTNNSSTSTINVSGGTLTATTGLTNNASAVITVSSTGILSIPATGTFTNTGTFNANGGTTNVVAASTTGIINSVTTGIFNVAGGTVNVGVTNNSACNRTFTNNGTMSVSSGTLNVYGNLAIPSGATFNQSGGNINVDGNAAGVAANSVASGTYLVNIGVPSTNISLTGGNFTIVDPSTNTGQYALYVTNASTTPIVASQAHNFIFGDGTSTDAGSTDGFYVNLWVSSTNLSFGTLTINGPLPLSSTRYFKSVYTLVVNGDVVVNSGGQFRPSGLHLGRNLTVNTNGIGLFTSALNLQNYDLQNGIITPSTSTQTISGGGTIIGSTTYTSSVGATSSGTTITVGSTTSLTAGMFVGVSAGVGAFAPGTYVTSIVNSTSFTTSAAPTTALSGGASVVSGFTGNISSIVLNNTNASGLTLSTPIATPSFTFTTGYINTSTGNELTITSGGSISGFSSTSYIRGPLQRIFPTTSVVTSNASAIFFPVGTGALYRPVHFSANVSGAAGGAFVSVEAASFGTGSLGSSISGPLSTDFWNIISSGPSTVGNANIGVTSPSATSGVNGIAYSTASSSTFDLFTIGTYNSTASSTVANLYSNPTTGQPFTSGFFRIATPNTCTTGPTSVAVTNNNSAVICSATNGSRTFTATGTPNSVGYTYQWQKGTSATGPFTDIATYNSAAGATSSGATITVTSTTGLTPGMVVTVSAGIGAFAANVTVATVPSATTFTTSAVPTTALSGGASVVTATATSASYNTGALTTAGSTYYIAIMGCTYGAGTTTSTTPAPSGSTATVVTSPTASITSTPSNGYYCGASNSPVTLAGSGASTMVWSPITSLFTDVNGTATPYFAVSNAGTVYARPASNTTYTLTVTDGNNCTATNTQLVTVPTAPVITSTTATPASVCSNSSAALAVVVPATGTYCTPTATNTSYFINNFSTTGGTANITNNASGLGTNSYSNFLAQNVNQAVGSSVSFSAQGNSTNTFGWAIWVDWNQNGTFETTERMFQSTGYVATISNSFTVPAGAVNGATRMRVIAEYLVSVPTDPCSVSTSHEAEDYTFNVTGGIAPPVLTYTWSPSGFISGATNAATATTTNLTATQAYTVAVDNGTCISYGNVTVTVSALSIAPTAAPAGPSGFCSPTATNTSYGIDNFTTTGGATNISNLGSGLGTNSYSSFLAKNVTQAVGSSVSFTIGAIGTTNTYGWAIWVDWNQNGTFETTERMFVTSAYTNTTSGSFTVPSGALNGTTRMRIINEYLSTAPANPCSVTTNHEAEDYTFTVTGGASNNCANTTWNLAANVTGGAPPYVYTWSVASGTSGLSATNIANPTVSNVTTNTYLLTVTDACTPTGSQSGSVTRTVNPSPTATIISTPTNGTYCGASGNPVTLAGSGSGTTGPYTTTWSAITGLFTDAAGTATPYTASANVATVYSRPASSLTYTLTVSDAVGCTGTATKAVAVSTPPIATATANPAFVCSGGSSNLTATIAGGSTYCTIASGNGVVGTDNITSVTLNTLSLSGVSGLVYRNNAASGATTTTLTAGNSYPVTVGIASGGSGAIVSVWVDFNQDGVLSASEWFQPYTSGFTGSINIIVPAGAKNGATRMRIRSRTTGNTNGSGDACSTFGSGNSEDFTVTITGGVAAGYTYAWTETGSTLTSTTGSTVSATGITGSTTYSVIVNDGSCNSAAASATVSISALAANATIGVAAGAYCTSINTSNTTYGINNFSTTGGSTNITNNASGLSANSYNYYTASNVTQSPGGTVNFSFTGISTNTYGFAIWVDWDHDGVFATTEKMYVTTGYVNSATGSFTVPSGALDGATRMRITSEYLASIPTDPCSATAYHETEDYDFIVSGGAAPGSCPGAGLLLAANVTGGGAPYSYSWTSVPAGFTSTAASITVNPLISTTYYVSVSDNCGGSTTSNVYANVTANPLSVSASLPSVCGYKNVTLTASGATTYTWSPNVGLDLNTGATVVSTPPAALLPVVVTGFNADIVANGIGNPTASTTADVDGSGNYLADITFQLTSSSSAQLYFVPSNRVVNSLVTTALTYNLASYSGSNSLRISSSTPGTLTIPSQPTATNVYLLATYAATSGTGTVSATVTFTDATTQAFTGITVGNWLTGTGYAAAGFGYISSLSVQGGSATTPRFYDLSLAINPANQLKQIASIDITRTSGTGIVHIMGVSVQQATPASTITYTVTGAQSGCNFTKSISYTYSAPPALAVDVTSATICSGTSTPTITLTAPSPTSIFNTYTWNAGATPSGSAPSWTISPAVSGTYTLTGTQTGGSQCVNKANVAVVVNPLPPAGTASFGSNPICENSTLQLNSLFGAASATILSEGFESGAPGWVITDDGSTGPAIPQQVFKIQSAPLNDATGSVTFSNFSVTGNYFVYANADAGASGSLTKSTVTSPAFSTVGYTGTGTLTFKNLYQYWSASTPTEIARVDISSDGTTWVPINDYSGANVGTTTSGSQVPATSTLTIPSNYMGLPNVQIRFVYVSNWGYIWILDDVAITGTLAPLTYSWSGTGYGPTAYSASPNATITSASSAANSGVFTVTAKTSLGCTITAVTPAVQFFAVPVLSSSLTASTCSGTLFSYTATGATTGSTFNWTRAGVTGIQNAASSNNATASISETLVNTTANPIDVIYAFTITANGCTNTQNMTVTVNPKPLLTSTTSPADVCSGTVFSYTASSATVGTTYSWTRATVSGISNAAGSGSSGSISETLINTTVAPVDVIYVVTLSANGCTNTQNVTVTINPSPTLTSSLTPAAICSGSTFTYSATSGTFNATFSWTRAVVTGISNAAGSGSSGGISEILTNTTSAPISVDYVFTLSANGCSNQQTVTVVVNPTPGLSSSLTPADVCSGTPFSYTATSAVSGATFSWTRATVSFISNAAGSGSSASISETLINIGTTPRTVTYVFTTSANGCSKVENVVVTVNPSPTLSSTLSPADICSGTVFSYTASSATSGTTYSWTRAVVTGISNAAGSGSNGSISETLTNTSAAPVDVIYAVTLTANGCSNTQSVTVTVNPSPTLTSTLTPTGICSGGTFTYTATSGTTGVTFSWTRAVVAGISNSAGSGSNSSISETLVNTTSSAINVVYVVSLSANGCSNSQNVTVSVTPGQLLSSSLTPPDVCSGTVFNYTATSGAAGATFSWTRAVVSGISNAAGSGSSASISETLVNTTTSPRNVTYVYTITANGCTVVDNVVVTVNPTPLLSSTLSPADVCSGTVFNYTATTVAAGTTFSWTRAVVTGISNAAGSGSSASISETLINTTAAPIDVVYAVTFTLSATGCMNTQNVTVTVNPSPTLTSSLTPAAICSGSTFNYSATSGTFGTTFSWTRAVVTGISNAAGSGSNSGISEILTNTSSAPISVDYVFTLSANGCSNQQTVTVVVNPTPVLSSTLTPAAVCGGTPFNYTATSAVSGATFSWTRAAVAFISNAAGSGSSASISETLNNIGTTPRTVTYVFTTSANGCSKVENVVVTVNPSLPNPTFTTSPGSSTCANTDVTYTTETGMSNYVWIVPGSLGVDYSISAGSLGSGSNTVTLKWLTAGSKTVTVNFTNTYGCTSSSPASSVTTVNAQQTPSVTIAITAGNNPTCNGGSVTFTATPVNGGTSPTYAWYRNGVLVPSNTTSTYTVMNITAATPVYVVMTVGTGICATTPTATSATTTITTVNSSWTGSFSNAWGDGRNWCAGVVPTATTDISIPVTSRNPLISAAASVRNINIASGAAVTMSNVTLTVNGTVAGTGTFGGLGNSGVVFSSTGNVGTLYFASTGIQALKLTGAGASATLGNATNVYGELSVGSATLNTGGNLTIKSNINGTSWVAPISTGTITGNVTVERYIPQNAFRAWRLLSVPVQGSQTFKQSWQENQAPLANGNPGFGTLLTSIAGGNGYDAATSGNSLLSFTPGAPGAYVAVSSTNNTMQTNAGYMVYIRGDRSSSLSGGVFNPSFTTLRTNGSLYIGTQPSILLPAGQNILVGNVYAAPIDFATMSRTAVTAFKVWDPKLQGTSNIGAYQTFSATNGYDPVPGGGSYGSIANSRIESGQAFIVSSGSGGSIQLTEAAKTTGSRNVFRTTTQVQQFKTKLYAITANGNELADGNAVVFDNGYSNGSDNADVVKMNNFAENLSIVSNNTPLVIESRKPLMESDVIQFGITNLKQQQYSLEFIPQNIDANVTGYLEDKFDGSRTPISLNSTTTVKFTVTSNTATSVSDRFRIVFNKNNSVPVSAVMLKAYQKGSNVQVDWKVANESSSAKQYEVEHSTDGRVFKKIGTIKAAGTGVNELNYSLLHEQPLNGDHYYQVKQVFNNGESKYTGVVKVTIGKDNGGFNIYPNPVVNNNVNIEFINQLAGNYTIRLLTMEGRSIFIKVVSHAGGSNTKSLKLASTIAAGTYHLEILSEKGVKTTQNLVISNK